MHCHLCLHLYKKYHFFFPQHLIQEQYQKQEKNEKTKNKMVAVSIFIYFYNDPAKDGH